MAIKLRMMPHRLPPALKRGNATKPVDPFYFTPEWVSFSKEMKRQRGYVCAKCNGDFRAIPFKLRCDHIVARKDGGADFDPLNVQVLCAGCDNRKRAVEISERGRGA